MNSSSSLFFYNLQGFAESLDLPTVQDLNVPDQSSIPSRPTITGEYRNQYVSKSARKVSFTLFLENGEVRGGQHLEVDNVLDKLNYLYKNRIKFNLTTSVQAELQFLTDLVIENISLNRDATWRGRIVAVINCVQVRLVDVGWAEASSVDIFGVNLFSSSPSSREQRNDFILSTVFDDFQLETDIWERLNQKFKNELQDKANAIGLSGSRQEPVNLIVRDHIKDKVMMSKDDLYLRLGSIIDMSKANDTSIYNCKGSIKSTYGLSAGEEEKPYDVDLIELKVEVKKSETSLVPGFSLGLASSQLVVDLQKKLRGTSHTNMITYKPDELLCNSEGNPTRFVYDFADTYKNFQIPLSMEWIQGFDELAKYLKIELEQNGFSEDVNAIGNHVIVKNYKIYTYEINRRYKYTINVCGEEHTFIPTGGLDIKVLGTFSTSKHNYKPIISESKSSNVMTLGNLQEIWDNKFKVGGTVNYKIQVVAVTLGAMLQLYAFAPGMLNVDMINCN